MPENDNIVRLPKWVIGFLTFIVLSIFGAGGWMANQESAIRALKVGMAANEDKIATLEKQGNKQDDTLEDIRLVVITIGRDMGIKDLPPIRK